MKFLCTSCGACCRRVGAVPNFPEPIKPDGSCIHLEDNKCKIYETRPELCRVEDLHGKVDHIKHLSLKRYYQLTNSVCNMYILQDGMDDAFLIDIKAYEV